MSSQNIDSHDTWSHFLASNDDLTSFGRCPIAINTDWVETLINDETKSGTPNCEKEFKDKFEDRRLEISNFDPDDTTKQDVTEVCVQYGEIEWIDMTEKKFGKINVKFFDLRSAYRMKLSTIRFHGFTWLIQFFKPESIDNFEKCVNSGKIAIVPLPESVTEIMIEDQFSQFGPIREVRRWKDHRFIEFWDDRSCAKAIEGMNDMELFGNKISVKQSRPYFRHRLNAVCRDERLPTVARTSKKTKVSVQFEIRTASKP